MWWCCGLFIGVEKGKWIIGVNWNYESWGGELFEVFWIDVLNYFVSYWVILLFIIVLSFLVRVDL